MVNQVGEFHPQAEKYITAKNKISTIHIKELEGDHLETHNELSIFNELIICQIPAKKLKNI